LITALRARPLRGPFFRPKIDQNLNTPERFCAILRERQFFGGAVSQAHFLKTKTLWGDKSRRRRKAGFIRISNQIREQAPWLGGLFATDDYLHQAAWIDAWMTSRRRKPLLYNATFDSALSAYFSRCDELASEAALAKMPFSRAEDLWVEQSHPLLGKIHALREAPPAQVDAQRRAFGGLTRFEWEDAESARLADSGDVWVLACSRLDPSYSFGVGLHATLPCDALSIEAVDAFAFDFFARAEPEFFELPTQFSYPNSRRGELRSANPLGAQLKDWAPLANVGASRRERAELEEALALAGSGNRAPLAL
jgi:hypothetical protein